LILIFTRERLKNQNSAGMIELYIYCLFVSSGYFPLPKCFLESIEKGGVSHKGDSGSL